MSPVQPRILFVIHQIGSGADGGIRSITELIAAAGGDAKHVVTNLESGVTDRLRTVAPVSIWDMSGEDGYGARGSKWKLRAKQVKGRLENNLRTYREVRRRKVDILHANDHRAFWNTVFGARAAGAKVIFNVRDTMMEGRPVGQWKRALTLCDRFLVLSKEMIESWRADLRPASESAHNRDKFAYIYSIVDRDVFFPVEEAARGELRQVLGIEEGRPVLAYVGRFDEKKAQLDFIELALPELKRRRPDAITYFVGDFVPEADPYAAKCAAAVMRLGLSDTVRFMGYSPRTADWYRAADIVLLASRREGLPRCMIESLACGTAFTTFDVCSAREILEGYDCGMVVPGGDYIAFAAVCAVALDDPERLARYRARGPTLTEQLFDSMRQGAQYDALARRLCDTGRASSAS